MKHVETKKVILATIIRQDLRERNERKVLQIFNKKGGFIMEYDPYLYDLLDKLIEENKAICDITPSTLDNIIQEIKKII